MTAVQFYHLTTTPLERALPRLLEKAVAGGYKTLLTTGSDEEVERINQLLWTYDQGSFLPHGSMADGNTQQQPILISTDETPHNNANLLFVVDGRTVSETGRFERIIDMFNGRDEAALTAARARWQTYKNSGFTVTYMSQTANGGWEQKT